MMARLTTFLVHGYRLLLLLYPRRFRAEFGDEMETTFAQQVGEAGQGGPGAVVIVGLRELRDVPGALLRAYALGWRQLQPLQPASAIPGPLWIPAWAVLMTAALPLAWFLGAPLASFLLLFARIGPDVAGPSLLDAGMLRALGSLAGLALTTALLQWLLLRDHVPQAGWWLPVTFLGWLIVGCAVGGMLLLERFATLSPIVARAAFPVAGATVGLAQWLFLRRVVPRAGWWLPTSMAAFSSVLLAGRAFTTWTEMVTVPLLPGAISGLGVWFVLGGPQWRGPTGLELPEIRGALPRSARHLLQLALIALLLVPLFFLGTWLYAAGQLAVAKRDGIYATPEEGMVALNSEGFGGAKVERIEGVRAGPNLGDGQLSHVWFATARVWMDRVPAGYDHADFFPGSFFIRVEGGWVHMPEGAFPEFIGRAMQLYGMEGVGREPDI